MNDIGLHLLTRCHANHALFPALLQPGSVLDAPVTDGPGLQSQEGEAAVSLSISQDYTCVVGVTVLLLACFGSIREGFLEEASISQAK